MTVVASEMPEKTSYTDPTSLTMLSIERDLFDLEIAKNLALLEIWTKKEAVFKMLGTGITKEIKNILDIPYINIKTQKIHNLIISVSYI